MAVSRLVARAEIERGSSAAPTVSHSVNRNRLVRTRLPGGVGSGRSILPATRLGVPIIICSFLLSTVLQNLVEVWPKQQTRCAYRCQTVVNTFRQESLRRSRVNHQEAQQATRRSSNQPRPIVVAKLTPTFQAPEMATPNMLNASLPTFRAIIFP